MNETDLDEIFGAARFIVLFDGHCGICTRATEWIAARDQRGHIRSLPNQTPGLAAFLGLSRAEIDRTVWVIDRHGRRFATAGAVNRILAEVGGGWRVLAGLYRIPVAAWVEERCYHWFARHRGRFARWGSVPACDRPAVDCYPEPEAAASA